MKKEVSHEKIIGTALTFGAGGVALLSASAVICGLAKEGSSVKKVFGALAVIGGIGSVGSLVVLSSY